MRFHRLVTDDRLMVDPAAMALHPLSFTCMADRLATWSDGVLVSGQTVEGKQLRANG